MISIKTSIEIKKLEAANHIVARALELATTIAKEGANLLDIDRQVEEFILSCGAKPSFKGLYGFPNASCLSLNEVVIHGIPRDYILKNGDILGIDIGTNLGGFFGDGAITVGIGEISSTTKKLIDCSRVVLMDAIESIKIGMRFKELSKILQDSILTHGFKPLHGFCGHGIGKTPHEEPEIPNYVVGNVNSGPKIKNGMVFCLEPMICQKSNEYIIASDKWSVLAKDGFYASHYEHTIAIVDGKPIILTEV